MTLRHALAIALVIATLSAPALADELSKEACVDAHSRGQDAKEQGKLSLARKLFLSCAQSSCPSLVQGDCARFADDLTRLQPTLSFVARDGSGADLPDTSVYVDGILTVTRLDDGKAHDVDPGAHTIKFLHGTHEESQTVVVGAGEKSRMISATFGAPPATLPVAVEPARPATLRQAPRVTHPLGAKLVLGVGAAMVVGGGVVGILGMMRVPDNCTISTHECAAPPGDPSFGKASSAIHLSNLGWITGAAGLVAVAGGVVWYLGGKRRTREDSVVAAPWLAPDGAGIAVMGAL